MIVRVIGALMLLIGHLSPCATLQMTYASAICLRPYNRFVQNIRQMSPSRQAGYLFTTFLRLTSRQAPLRARSCLWRGGLSLKSRGQIACMASRSSRIRSPRRRRVRHLRPSLAISAACRRLATNSLKRCFSIVYSMVPDTIYRSKFSG